MSARTRLFALLGILACSSVAVADKMSPPVAGTYVVEQQKGIDYGRALKGTPKGEDEASSQGASFQMDAYLPKQVERAVPAVVMISGTGTEANSEHLEKNAGWLASHGYAVFTPNYPSGENPRTAFRDLRTAVRFIRANCVEFGVDPYRIGVWGCAGGGSLAVALGLVGDQLPATGDQSSEGQRASKNAVSARIQTVVVTGKENPISERVMSHVGFDDPPFLLVLASDSEETGLLPTPEPFAEAGVEYVAYRVPGEAPCRTLGCVLTVDGKESPIWRLVLDFADEHLKETPRNLAVVLEREILRRIRAQGWMLGSQSIIDLRAVLQLAAHRLGREPTPQEMQIAREHAQKLADELVEVAAADGAAPRITRMMLAEGISRLSPQWPFTTTVRPATVPPVPRGRRPFGASEE